jgi:hypothetical protein
MGRWIYGHIYVRVWGGVMDIERIVRRGEGMKEVDRLEERG